MLGDYKQSDYGDINLSFTVLRRLDCVLNKKKEAVLEKNATLKKMNEEAAEKVLNKIAGVKFDNKSKYDFKKLVGDPIIISRNLRNYIAGFFKQCLGNSFIFTNTSRYTHLLK